MSTSIWVSPDGRDGNDGTAGSPLRTIQRAVELAEPGTTIAVKAGTYVENIKISGGVNSKLNQLTADKPLEIVSVDGIGAAVIKSADDTGYQSTIFSVGMSHLRIAGFQIDGNMRYGNDGGPLKVIGSPTGPAENPSTDVVIENNIFTGLGESMVKVTKTSDVYVANNSFEGRATQNFIDMVTVWDSTVEANDFVGNAWLGMTMKAGSQNNVVQNNLFDFEGIPGKDTQTAVLVGGVGHSRLNREPLPAEFDGYEAKNISVLANKILSDTRSSVMFQGGVESLVQGNVLGASGGTAIKSAHAPSQENESDCRDNTVIDNILVGVDTRHEATADQTKGYVIRDNVPGSVSDASFAYGIGATGGGDVSDPAPDPDPGTTEPEPEPEPESPDPTDENAGDGNQLVVRAGGTGTDAAAPEFEVFADGVSLGKRAVSNPQSSFDTSDDALFRDYVFEFGGAAPEQVEVVYLNDGTSGTINRDLAVDYIEINGAVFESEEDGWFTADNGKTKFAGAQEMLYVNGVLGFDGLEVNSPPAIAPVADVTVTEGETASFAVTASDPDGGAPALSVSVKRSDGSTLDPSEYVFADDGNGAGQFSWATDSADDGTYAVTVTAEDGLTRTTETLALTVNDSGSGSDSGAVPAGGTLTVRAGGTGTASAAPEFEVLADGVSLGVASISNPQASGFDAGDDSLFNDYAFEFDGDAPARVDIVYRNDGTTDGVNRDLVVDYIDIDGLVFESETDGDFAPDNGKEIFAGATEALYVDGVLSFDGLEDALL